MMKILMVLTSHDKLGNMGRKTGFWLEEFAAPYFTFLDARASVTVASPKGGSSLSTRSATRPRDRPN
jgi:putative intracellular protease/amidase